MSQLPRRFSPEFWQQHTGGGEGHVVVGAGQLVVEEGQQGVVGVVEHGLEVVGQGLADVEQLEVLTGPWAG